MSLRRNRNVAKYRLIPSCLALLLALVGGGCQTTQSNSKYETSLARFVMESTNQGAVVTLPVSGVRIQVNPKAQLTEFDIVDVEVAEVELGKCLQFTLTRQASRQLYQMSVANQGRRLVLLVNGAAVGLRRIEGPISDGILHIYAEVSNEELSKLANNLRGTSLDIQSKIDR